MMDKRWDERDGDVREKTRRENMVMNMGEEKNGAQKTERNKKIQI
jgi:hypothetical protein